MTTLRGTRYDRPRHRGGSAIPHVDPTRVSRTTGATAAATAAGSAKAAATPAGGAFDWGRLERAVEALVGQQERLRREVRELRAALDSRDGRIRKLEAQVLDLNQRRQDTGKRIDELISQLDQLDVQLASVEPAE